MKVEKTPFLPCHPDARSVRLVLHALFDIAAEPTLPLVGADPLFFYAAARPPYAVLDEWHRLLPAGPLNRPSQNSFCLCLTDTFPKHRVFKRSRGPQWRRNTR